MKLGILGLKNNDNGHPFSFSAIINGYNKSKFKKTRYKNILKYLDKKPQRDFGIKGVKITHAWTQNKNLTKSLCESCYIDNALNDYRDMIGKVDGVIIARDDLHYKLSKIFLNNKIPVFIDKPLTLKIRELRYFKKYLNKGLLMSTSGLRFADEINFIKKNIKSVGKIKSVHAVVLNDFVKYGIHMLDIMDELNLLKVNYIKRHYKNIDQITFFCNKKITINLECLGKVRKIFSIQIIGTSNSIKIDIEDNFLAFKNTLKKFVQMVKNRKQVLNSNKTLNVINLLIQTSKLKNGKIQRFKK